MKKIEFVLNIPTESNLVKLCSGMVHHASEFKSDIQLSTEGSVKIDLKSILGIMSLCMSNGKRVTIEINGSDEDEAYMCLEKYTNYYKKD